MTSARSLVLLLGVAAALASAKPRPMYPDYRSTHRGDVPLRVVNRAQGKIDVYIRPVSARPSGF